MNVNLSFDDGCVASTIVSPKEPDIVAVPYLAHVI